MSRNDGGQLRAVRQTAEGKKAVLFIHGFTGHSDDTWGLFPDLLKANVSDWDIYTLGYATTLQPDVVGVWSADPDLPILATLVRTELGVSPLNAYRELALVAHSMGGLIVQQALVDDGALGARLRHLVLFGTPSNGLAKAWFLAFWKRQLRNMAVGSAFITNLRANWTKRFGAKPPFDLVVIAGDKDQFVPPGSSLHPFDKAFHKVVRGNHLEMVKPANQEHLGFRVLTATLSAGMREPTEVTAPLKLEAERPDGSIEKILGDIKRPLTESEVVDAALALERAGKRSDAIELLTRNQQLGTDVRGVLAGRIKRLWIETGSEDYARWSLALYEAALEEATRKNDHEQAYYHAINVAFYSFVVFDRKAEALEKARLAVKHCDAAKDDVWNRATRAEASLYLGDPKQAIEQYRLLPKHGGVQAWQLASAALQAGIIACKLGDRDFLDALDDIFTPGSRKSAECS
jgi:pimeloyl-ACP methyl ester carboxylesterase